LHILGCLALKKGNGKLRRRGEQPGGIFHRLSTFVYFKIAPNLSDLDAIKQLWILSFGKSKYNILSGEIFVGFKATTTRSSFQSSHYFFLSSFDLSSISVKMEKFNRSAYEYFQNLHSWITLKYDWITSADLLH
jgi:hypothetical protein